MKAFGNCSTWNIRIRYLTLQPLRNMMEMHCLQGSEIAAGGPQSLFHLLGSSGESHAHVQGP